MGQELPLGKVVCPQYHLTSAGRTRVQQKSLANPARHTRQGVAPARPSLPQKPRFLGCLPTALPCGCSKSRICLWTSEANFRRPPWPHCPPAPGKWAALPSAPHFPWGWGVFTTGETPGSTTLPSGLLYIFSFYSEL